MLTNARVLLYLLRFTGRVQLAPLAGGALIGLGVTALPAMSDMDLSAANHTMLLRIAAAATALGAAFALDDPAARTTAVVPVTRLIRHGARAVPAVVAAAAAWSAALAVTWLGAAADVWRSLPLAGLSLEAATLIFVALGCAAALRHFAEQAPGVAAAPAVLLYVAAAAMLPSSAALFVDPQTPRWTAAHRVWLAVLIVGAALFVAASRDTFRSPSRHPGKH